MEKDRVLRSRDKVGRNIYTEEQFGFSNSSEDDDQPLASLSRRRNAGEKRGESCSPTLKPGLQKKRLIEEAEFTSSNEKENHQQELLKQYMGLNRGEVAKSPVKKGDKDDTLASSPLAASNRAQQSKKKSLTLSEGAKKKGTSINFYGESDNFFDDSPPVYRTLTRSPKKRKLFQHKKVEPNKDEFEELPDIHDDPVVDVEESTLRGIKKLDEKIVSPYLSEVRVSPEVMEVCWSHALSSENQEIMGLLIGNSDENKIVYVRTLMVGKRSTKESARVEVNENELVEGLMMASSLKDENGAELRVVGWYHSHPHITVLPSRVDLRTQSGYQLMDSKFVGLIFSVYCKEYQTEQITNRALGFQSGDQKDDGNFHMYEIPIKVQDDLSMVNEEVFVSVYTSLADTWVKPFQEEMEEYEKYVDPKAKDILADMHNDSLLTYRVTNLCRNVMEPAIQSLEMKLKELEIPVLKEPVPTLTEQPNSNSSKPVEETKYLSGDGSVPSHINRVCPDIPGKIWSSPERSNKPLTGASAMHESSPDFVKKKEQNASHHILKERDLSNSLIKTPKAQKGERIKSSKQTDLHRFMNFTSPADKTLKQTKSKYHLTSEESSFSEEVAPKICHSPSQVRNKVFSDSEEIAFESQQMLLSEEEDALNINDDEKNVAEVDSDEDFNTSSRVYTDSQEF